MPFELGWLFLFAVIPALFIGAVVVVVVILLKDRDRGVVRTSGARPPALALLEERYARGEIGRDDFAERRAVLLRGAEPPPVPQAPGTPRDDRGRPA